MLHVDSLQDPVVKDVERNVRCEVDPRVERETTSESVPARIILALNSGATHELFVSAPKGSPSRPFTSEDHEARFRRELERRWSKARCDEVISISRRLKSLPAMEQLVRLLA